MVGPEPARWVSQRPPCAVGSSPTPRLYPCGPEAEAGIHRLSQPLQVAVTGRVSAGKSTLVNALAGRRVALTGDSETTSVNCAFVHAESGSAERAEIHLTRADSPVRLPIDELATLTGIDATVPIPIVVHLTHPLLERLTVIDSPGLGSPIEERSERAARVTGATRDAIGVADAVLFVTSELPGRQSEYADLDRFRRLFGDVRRAPTNSVYVFNQANRIDGTATPDPVDRLCQRLNGPNRRMELRQRVAAATASIGLLAEAARTGFVDARLVEDLRRLRSAVLDVRDLADRPLLAPWTCQVSAWSGWPSSQPASAGSVWSPAPEWSETTPRWTPIRSGSGSWRARASACSRSW